MKSAMIQYVASSAGSIKSLGNKFFNAADLEMIPRSCPVCKQENQDIIYEDANYLESAGLDIFHSPVSYKFCFKCRLIYMDPAFSDRSNEYIYSRLMIFPISSTLNDSPMIIKKLENLIYLFEKHHANNNRKNFSVLEVGSGTGEVLSLFTKHYNNKITAAVGIEPSVELSARSAKRFNTSKLQIINAILEKYFAEEKFDFIILDNVFEHLNEPHAVLEKLNSMLNADGAMYFSLPDILKPTVNTIRDIYSAHPQIYSGFALEKLLNVHGLAITQVKNTNLHNNFLIQKKSIANGSCVNYESCEEILAAVNSAIFAHRENTQWVINTLQPQIDDLSSKNKKLVVFGAGDHTLSLLSIIDFHNMITAIIDNNDTLWFQKKYGYEIYPPSQINSLCFNAILISSYSFEKELIDICEKTLKISREKIIKIYS